MAAAAAAAVQFDYQYVRGFAGSIIDLLSSPCILPCLPVSVAIHTYDTVPGVYSLHVYSASTPSKSYNGIRVHFYDVI